MYVCHCARSVALTLLLLQIAGGYGCGGGHSIPAQPRTGAQGHQAEKRPGGWPIWFQIEDETSLCNVLLLCF